MTTTPNLGLTMMTASPAPWGALSGLSDEERRAHKKRVNDAWRAKNMDRIRAYQREYRAKDPNKAKTDNAKWRKENAERVRANNRKAKLKSLYGLTEEQLEEMRAAQNYECALCLKVKPLNVDHSHSIGKVRKLLCVNCNTSLGKFDHDPELLRRAADYIEAYRKQEAC